MKTNTVQLHKKVKYSLDQTNSPRFRIDQIDEALNDSIDMILMDRFKPESPQDTQRGLQRNRILRDELKPLVKVVSTSDRNYKEIVYTGGGYQFTKDKYYTINHKESGTDLTESEQSELISIGATEGTGTSIMPTEFISNKTVVIDIANSDKIEVIESDIFLLFDSNRNMLLSEYLPDNYNYYALIRIEVNGIKSDPFEITFEQVATIMQDPFSRPSIDLPIRTYHFESSDGFHFLTGDRGVITNVELFYLSIPTKVKYGKEVQLSEAPINESAILGQESAVVTGDGDFNEDLSYGDEFTVPENADPGKTIVIIKSVKSEMPESLVREIVANAAKILMVTVEKFDKAQHTN